jgi:NitT/TauT family transport system ATP-binding protein
MEKLLMIKGIADMQEYKIQAKNLTKIFKTKSKSIVAVKDVSFNIHKRELVSLIGPSGCGKSTIIRLVNGIIKPTSGSITLFGETFNDGVDDLVKRKMGFIFQSPNLLPWLTVRQNLELPLKVFKLDGKDWYDNVDKLLDMVGMSECADLYPQELSGGMIQRIGVIRAMVHDPEILLMDEPFGSLDELNREKLDIEILKIWEDTGKTIIFITHNIEEAILISSRILVMGTDPGRIVEEVEINLPAKRTISLLSEPEFIAYEEKVTELIGDLELNKIK